MDKPASTSRFNLATSSGKNSSSGSTINNVPYCDASKHVNGEPVQNQVSIGNSKVYLIMKSLT